MGRKKNGCRPNEGLIGKRCVDINEQLESSMDVAKKSKKVWGVEPPSVKILEGKVYVLDEASFTVYAKQKVLHSFKTKKGEIYQKVGVSKSKDPIYGYYVLMKVTNSNLQKIKKKMGAI